LTALVEVFHKKGIFHRNRANDDNYIVGPNLAITVLDWANADFLPVPRGDEDEHYPAFKELRLADLADLKILFADR
jgi:hypothetical protein